MKKCPLYAAGKFTLSNAFIEVLNPYTNLPIASVSSASEDDLERAIQSAKKTQIAYKSFSSLEVSNALLNISLGIEQNLDRFVATIISESAKPHIYALAEVKRAIETFRMAAYEACNIKGEILSLDDAQSGIGLKGRVEYFSSGIIAGISPFNFPLNLVAHKVAPAIATKSPIILKPSSSTPLTALLLAEIIDKANLPSGSVAVLPCSREIGDLLVTDERINVLSFTGSPEVGWSMKTRSGKKKVILELGGNAAAIVHNDADYKLAINQCLTGSFAYSGQVCIHTQRIYVQRKIFDLFLSEFVNEVTKIKNDNPENESCLFSVMIDEKNAIRVENWVNEAQEQGAVLVFGGKRNSNFVEPTVLTNTKPGMKVHDEEVFGPVVCINVYDDFDEAIHGVNDSRFGLQASIFTNHQTLIEKSYKELEVGGVILNKATTFRTDQMPYGGVKDSGFGREGIKYAMMDYMEPKLLVF